MTAKPPVLLQPLLSKGKEIFCYRLVGVFYKDTLSLEEESDSDLNWWSQGLSVFPFDLAMMSNGKS